MKPPALRTILMGLIVLGMFAAMLGKLAVMQVVQQDDYIAMAEERSTKTYALYGNRGTIYDCNMIPLAYDRSSYNVTFYRDPSLTSGSNRAAYTQSIIRAIEIIEQNGKKVDLEFWLERDENGKWQIGRASCRE